MSCATDFVIISTTPGCHPEIADGKGGWVSVVFVRSPQSVKRVVHLYKTARHAEAAIKRNRAKHPGSGIWQRAGYATFDEIWNEDGSAKRHMFLGVAA